MTDNVSCEVVAEHSARIRPIKLAHLVLRSGERFEETCEWYRNALNADYVHKDENVAFMTYDDEHHRVAVSKIPGIEDRPYDKVGLDHIAFTFATLSDLLLTYERLKKGNILPFLGINHGPTTSLYYKDPDRTMVEFQVDNFPNFEEFMKFVGSGVLDKNPIGVEFDPEVMLSDFYAGRPAAELQQYREGPLTDSVMERLTKN